jgi:glycosyltransferase involved in cell wall biosynthesis
MIYGVVITYNDFPLIVKTVESLLPFCTEIIAVDGKYSDFPQLNGSDYSTDGTTEYLESIDNVRLIYAAGLQEVEKRNLYLVGNVGDWYVHLDADEEWVGPLEIPDTDMGIVKLRRTVPQHYMDRIRLFRHVEGISYRHKHYWLFDGEGRTFALLEKPGNNYLAARLDNNLIIHHGEERLPERVAAKRQYYRVLTRREGPIREIK